MAAEGDGGLGRLDGAGCGCWGGTNVHQQTCFSTGTVTNNDQLSAEFGHFDCSAGILEIEEKGSVDLWAVGGRGNEGVDGETSWTRKKMVVMGWVVSGDRGRGDGTRDLEEASRVPATQSRGHV